MTVVTQGFGVALLATALWITSPVLPGWAVMLGVALLLIIPAIYLHALDPLPPSASGWKRLWKGVGVSMLVAGCGVLVGLLSGARDPLQPLAEFHSAAAATTEPTRFERIASVQELETRLKTAKGPGIAGFLRRLVRKLQRDGEIHLRGSRCALQIVSDDAIAGKCHRQQR